MRLIRAMLALPDMYSEDEETEDHLDRGDEDALIRPVSVAVVRAIVSVAENQEEKLRLACLETLAELGERRPLAESPSYR